MASCCTPLLDIFRKKNRVKPETSFEEYSETKKHMEEQHASCHPLRMPCETSSSSSVWLLGDSDEELPAYDENPANKENTAWLSKEIIGTLNKRIDELSPELRELSLKIHDHPELSYQEHYAHDTLTEFMESHGFKVERHYLELATAWKASFSYSSSSQTNANPRTLGLNSEMDALPGIGHACGHNLIAIAGVAVALAVKSALEEHDLSGNIILLGTPAEEAGGGKCVLIERGAYKEMDLCLMCHPGAGSKKSSGTGPSLAVFGLNVEYFGHSAHASAAPWEGQNALDAAFLAYSGISVLRQQIKPDQRVHGIIEGREWAPNIIPDYAKMRWLVRAPTAAEAEVLKQRVLNCFNAAALATACKVEITPAESLYDLRQNAALAEEYENIVSDQYGVHIVPMAGAIGGSTDFGNVTYELPSLHPAFAIPTPENGGNHTIGFTEAARTMEAHRCTLRVVKALSQTGLRAILDDGYMEKIKEAFNPNK